MHYRRSPRKRPTKHALAFASAARPAACKWNSAAGHEQSRVNRLLGDLRTALSHKARGLPFKVRRLAGGLCRTWDDYLALIKTDVRGAQMAVRQHRAMAARTGFAIP